MCWPAEGSGHGIGGAESCSLSAHKYGKEIGDSQGAVSRHRANRANRAEESVGLRSSIFCKMRLAFSTASAMAHSRAGHGLTPISLSFRAAKIVAAKRIAYFRCSSI